MGLDGVELILAVEDAFQIELSDAEAGGAYTVGDLYELVVGKLGTEGSTGCVTSVAFYRTRRALSEVCGYPRREIRPKTILKDVLTGRDQWHAVERASGLRLPERVFGPWHLGGVMTISVAVGVWCGWHWWTGLVWLATVGVLLRATRSFASVRARIVTVGDLAREVGALNHGRLTRRGWNGDEVWESLCQVIVSQTGLDRARITRDAAIVADLGIE
jgi:hypothetical protein